MTRVHFYFLFVSTLCSITTKAQVYIPDQGERDWLNATIPGIVDSNGVMDTLHPGIEQVHSLSFSSFQFGSELRLVGLQYLYELRNLYISTELIESLIIEGLPNTVDTLLLFTSDAAISLPSLPQRMRSIAVYGMYNGSLTIAQMPDTIDMLIIDRIPRLYWEEGGHIQHLILNEQASSLQLQSIVLPPFDAEIVNIRRVSMDSIDLSASTVRSLHLTDTEIGHVEWPMNVVEIYMILQPYIPSDHFPSTLLSLSAYVISGCIPPLPEGLLSLATGWLPSNSVCIPNWPESLVDVMNTSFTQEYGPYCSVLNSTCPGALPGIAGRVFIDLNGNDVFDMGEPGLPQTSVTLQPNGNVVSCTPDGRWEVGVAPGNYTISAASNYPYALSTTPAEHTANVPNMGDADTDNDFAVTLIPDIQDLRVHLYADPARPGFDNQVYLRCENYGTTAVDATVTFTFDVDQTWLGSSVAPTTTIGNTATWSFPAMPIGAVQQIVVDLNTAAIVPLGTAVTHTMIADPTSTDETPQDNVYAFNDSVVGSYDPNDKLLSPAVLTPIDVALGETPIEYTIRFQNTGTYHAERVVILDTLSSELQWESMRFIASSHAHNWYITDGVLHVIHNNIMLPESNANEPASHGFFTFSMLPKTNLGNGAVIENIAHIVFDFNEPIVTEPAVFMVDIGAGIAATTNGNALHVHPNPAQDRIQLTNGMILPYRIMNALGQPMQQGLLAPGAWLDVQALPAGAYIMETTEADARTSLRFLKQ